MLLERARMHGLGILVEKCFYFILFPQGCSTVFGQTLSKSIISVTHPSTDY
jgi:hypothetical protein